MPKQEEGTNGLPAAGIGASGDGQLGSEGSDRGAPPGEAAAHGDAQPPPAHLHREDRQRQNPRERGRPPAGAAVRRRQVKAGKDSRVPLARILGANFPFLSKHLSSKPAGHFRRPCPQTRGHLRVLLTRAGSVHGKTGKTPSIIPGFFTILLLLTPAAPRRQLPARRMKQTKKGPVESVGGGGEEKDCKHC